MSYLKKLHLSNCRIHENINFSFKKGINLIVGDNGSGKTTILEAIYILSVKKSFKKSHINEYKSLDKDELFIKGEVWRGEISEERSYHYVKNTKKFIINEKNINKLEDCYKNFRVLYYYPVQKVMIFESSEDRRTYFDLIFTHLDDSYLTLLRKYRNILYQKNALLKKKNSNLVINSVIEDVVNQEFIKTIDLITTKRRELIGLLNEKLALKLISCGKMKKMSIKYEQNVDKYKLINLSSEEKLKEINQACVLFGAHKDDYKFIIKEKEVKIYSSFGQQKNFILILLEIVVEILKTQDINVIILIDDAFCELDAKHRNELIESLKEENQVFLSVQDTYGLSLNLLEEINIIKLGGDNG